MSFKRLAVLLLAVGPASFATEGDGDIHTAVDGTPS